MRRTHNTLPVGILNFEYGRDPQVVQRELHEAFMLYGLGALCGQEAADYRHMLQRLPFADCYTDTSARGNTQNVILVAKDRKARFPRYKTVGDGWIVGGGREHAPSPFPRVTVDGIRLGSVHWPSDTKWVRGRVTGPRPRINDVEAQAKQDARFLRFPGKRAILGDFNEDPDTQGLYTPSWVAHQGNARIAHPGTKWNIDYAIYKGVKVVKTFKDFDLSRGDHPLVVVVFDQG
jgi:hypothetical protein